jgi:beta-glucanase (GH16 family)
VGMDGEITSLSIIQTVQKMRLLKDGSLIIQALKEDYMGSEYTSARMITMDLQEFQYGRIEARIDLPTGKGIWPAFWMLGADFPEVGWPDCGEIDIMEHLGQ